MVLKDRKKINNVPRFQTGSDAWKDITGYVDTSDAIQEKTLPVDSSLDVMGRMVKKQIANRQATQVASRVGSIAQGATSIASGALNMLGGVKSQDELLAEAGTSNQTIMGVNYQQQNSINGDAELSSFDSKGIGNTLSSTASGASAGAAFGPWGAVIGGAVGLLSGIGSWIGGKSKLRKRIENAKQLATRRNTQNMASAMSQGMQQQYYGEHQNTTDGILYAYHGKDLFKPKRK